MFDLELGEGCCRGTRRGPRERGLLSGAWNSMGAMLPLQEPGEGRLGRWQVWPRWDLGSPATGGAVKMLRSNPVSDSAGS